MNIAVTVLAPPVYATVSADGFAVQIAVQGAVAVQVAVLGIQGGPGIGGTLSADEGNVLTLGSDNGLYVPPALASDGGQDLTLIFDNQLL